jgi:hypothetical protein
VHSPVACRGIPGKGIDLAAFFHGFHSVAAVHAKLWSDTFEHDGPTCRMFIGDDRTHDAGRGFKLLNIL